MTPAARVAAAIEILDRVIAGACAEQVLTGWARGNRFAGSKDRAAIRDHVYGALRCLRSFAALAGADTPSGRPVMIGALRAAGEDPEAFFTGAGYAPSPLTSDEVAGMDVDPDQLDALVAVDCPDWLAPQLREALADEFEPVLRLLQNRAPVILRINARSEDRHTVQDRLRAEGIETKPHPLAKNALQVVDGDGKIKSSLAYADGLVELQDASPQAAIEALPLRPGMRVLDYCAGGGGKVLAMAAQANGRFFAHDALPNRMRDLPARAERAGVNVSICATEDLEDASFDLVLLDVPCSGSGTWRRDPDAKWKLTADQLSSLLRTQETILAEGAKLVAPGGMLAYMTCSLLNAENQNQISAFLSAHPAWALVQQQVWTPILGGDGFFSAQLTRT
ncbi:MAG: RsmB/NOP family class I SAM-dependent RNA methyltransferase [Albidovulum sp.]